MFRRKQVNGERRRLGESISTEEERRGSSGNRRFSMFERRSRIMDRRQRYDEFWMGARDRRIRIMDRRNRGK